MDYDAQLKLQAWLDGELPEPDTREMAKRLERDAEAAALAQELRNTQQALAGLEADLRLPESREFFWSKIERELRRLETPGPERASSPLLARWRRFLVPASGIALVAIVGLLALQQGGGLRLSGGTEMETTLADTGAFTYRDYSAGATLVWLSYPAEDEAADDEVGIVE
jgi:anti-sigma factor RsiW